MIIWGSIERVKAGATGSFNCPSCRAPRQYTQMKSQTWFTLYFIPIFPMITHGEHVECTACANAFEIDALGFDPAKEQASRDAITANLWRSVIISVACAFGQPNGVQAKLICSLLLRFWGVSSTPHEILGDCGQVTSKGVSEEEVVNKLASLPDLLSPQSKEDFLAAAREVLRAGYGSAEQQGGLLKSLGKALGMSDAHIRGVIML